MAEQEQQQRASDTSGEQNLAEVDTSSAPSGQTQELKDQIDGLLDEIDEVLESNAEEFVKSYIQKGGE
jgi:ubiquitin-like protein Pup